MGRHAGQSISTLAPLPESEDVEGPAQTAFDSVKRVPSSPPGKLRNRADPGLSNEIELAARKAHRIADIRTIGQEAAHVVEHLHAGGLRPYDVMASVMLSQIGEPLGGVTMAVDRLGKHDQTPEVCAMGSIITSLVACAAKRPK